MNPRHDHSPERRSTDGSLRAERNKTDSELALKRAAIEERADAVVGRARDRADEVVQAARNLADTKSTSDSSALAKERAGEDAALQAERLDADEGLRREREERKRALSSLLRLEREETDEDLMTERGRSDEALSTRDILLAMVSHDLRNLLGGIALSAELMVRDAAHGPGGPAPILPRAQLIQRSVARMNRILGDLVDIASIESGKLVMEPSPQDLTALVGEAIETFQLSAAARDLTLTLETSPQPVSAVVDHDRIVQVLANLFTNAIKFTGNGGRIAVRVEVVAGAAQVSVADTGPGIAAEHLEPIFSRFWQVGRSDRRGLGLGLYIARCILEGHGGRIWAESVGGAGSTFYFQVPAA